MPCGVIHTLNGVRIDSLEALMDEYDRGKRRGDGSFEIGMRNAAAAPGVGAGRVPSRGRLGGDKPSAAGPVAVELELGGSDGSSLPEITLQQVDLNARPQRVDLHADPPNPLVDTDPESLPQSHQPPQAAQPVLPAGPRIVPRNARLTPPSTGDAPSDALEWFDVRPPPTGGVIRFWAAMPRGTGCHYTKDGAQRPVIRKAALHRSTETNSCLHLDFPDLCRGTVVPVELVPALLRVLELGGVEHNVAQPGAAPAQPKPALEHRRRTSVEFSWLRGTSGTRIVDASAIAAAPQPRSPRAASVVGGMVVRLGRLEWCLHVRPNASAAVGVGVVPAQVEAGHLTEVVDGARLVWWQRGGQLPAELVRGAPVRRRAGPSVVLHVVCVVTHRRAVLQMRAGEGADWERLRLPVEEDGWRPCVVFCGGGEAEVCSPPDEEVEDRVPPTPQVFVSEFLRQLPRHDAVGAAALALSFVEPDGADSSDAGSRRGNPSAPEVIRSI
eukprot:TRINITY_DN10203_c0_g1_i1.p1 TRINITY_DN10203_c0_g1~~TRINITY_DN10203_c0_g1_i1.p1  ORF type:complete len:583 (+),score=151.92 TRINITY_DN10203_c0_g1_i1:260-1750(+)